MAKNRAIGKDNQMPWHLSADMKHFVKETTGGTVIMGRKTWESIPEKFRPFKDRQNIVITRNEEYQVPEGVLLAHSLDQALNMAESKAFIIGGGTIYKEAIQHESCNELIITEIDKEFEADTFFPEIPNDFVVKNTAEWQTEKDLNFRFLYYVKESS